jgi:hypothetical protein
VTELFMDRPLALSAISQRMKAAPLDVKEQERKGTALAVNAWRNNPR